MNRKLFLERLKTLLGRLASLGIDAGVAALSITAAWGIYCFMQAGG